uniref:3'-5' exonuclease domain-containing protein n=1 Tax=Biomphalaria glabrata TaxID=6526 RepID=A0A2C9LLN1_BIOGL
MTLLLRTSRSLIVITSLIFGSACIASWIAWKYMKRRKKNVFKPYNLCRSIYVVKTSQEWDEVYIQLLNDLQHAKVIGLDCEWVHKNKVALLQLASATDTCILVCMNKLFPSLPASLRALLADKSILKVGVAVVDDGKRLEKDYGLKVNGCVDLRHVLKRIRQHFICQSKGLQGLARGVLGVDIVKTKSIRCGNWETEKLSEEQVHYAATDAAVAIDIFLAMVNKKMKHSLLNCMEAKSKFYGESQKIVQDQPNEQPHDASSVLFNNKSEVNFWKLAFSMCQGLIDCSYSGRIHHAGDLSTRPRQINRNKVKSNSYSTRQRPLWDNCKLEAPDGALLCTCDTKKAQWYLDNKLGDAVCEDPLTVRLRFEPANRPQSDRNYYLQEKENLCVVCGHDKDYVRKYIVPSEYRKYLPEQLKDHSSHDVLLLCTDCHRKSCDSDIILRMQLAQECNAPLESGSSAKVVLDHDLQKVRSAARALKANRKTIPEKRVHELEEILKMFYGVGTISQDVLEQATSIDARFNREDYIPHGKKVVEHVKKTKDLLSFQARWRQHFLDTMKPQFLPAFWSVDYVPECWIHQKPQTCS